MPARMRGGGVHSGRGEVSATARAVAGENDSRKEENDGEGGADDFLDRA